MTAPGSQVQVRSAALRTAATAARDVSQQARATADEIDAIVSAMPDAMAATASAGAVLEFAAGWKGSFALRLDQLHRLADKLDTAADGYDESDSSAAKRLDSL
ncbi:MAG TPA: hypothetical protein VFC19_29345 [Candidatus Limnocylindrales bacterium]|nr:hypothetical protein [Candidatus Limnocylindrales bacterium]